MALQGGKDPVRHRALGGGRPEASGLREAPPGRERPRERARGAEGEWGAQAGPRSAGSAHRRQLAARRGSAERRAMEPSPKDGESAAAAEPSRGAGSSSGVVVQVREKKGPLRAAIPYMPFPVAVICLFLNTFVPGLGKELRGTAAVTCRVPEAGGERAPEAGAGTGAAGGARPLGASGRCRRLLPCPALPGPAAPQNFAVVTGPRHRET